MTKHTLYTALLALFVGSSAAVPVQALTLGERVPVAQNETALDRAGEPVTVRVTNNNWLDMRIYVVETSILRRRWPLGDVTGLSTARFEIPKHVGAELGNLVLVAVAIGSRERRFTHRLQTWPGARVDWNLGAALRFSYATVF